LAMAKAGVGILIAMESKILIHNILIGNDLGLVQHLLFNHAHGGQFLNVRRDASKDATLALHDAEHGSFLAVSGIGATSVAPTLAAHVHLVNFYARLIVTAKAARIFRKHGANLFEHSPRALVG